MDAACILFRTVLWVLIFGQDAAATALAEVTLSSSVCDGPIENPPPAAPIMWSTKNLQPVLGFKVGPSA